MKKNTILPNFDPIQVWPTRTKKFDRDRFVAWGYVWADIDNISLDANRPMPTSGYDRDGRM